jgi:Alr-MurF fusion protein
VKILASDIEKITGGKLTGPPDLEVLEIVTDSRQLSYTEGVLFIAISGNNHDGHVFIPSLYSSGVRIFLVERFDFLPGSFVDAAFIIVENSIRALQLLGGYKRKNFTSPVIAVTGSTGKTIVKEWLSEIAGAVLPVVRSPKSYNSQIGVPLSLWKLDNRYALGIFEAGISRPGEMEKLSKIICPDIGIITNIGEAHSENFSGNREKAAEKLVLFRDSDSIIYCRDNELIHQLIINDPVLKGKKLIDWSFSDIKSTARVHYKLSAENETELEITFRNEIYIFKIPFIDRASVENSATVAIASLYLGINPEAIKRGFANLAPVAMRMEKKSGINNSILIEDFYNSDPGSLVMAIEYLNMQNFRRKTLILSDFVQSGRNSSELYGEIAELIRKTGIDRFIAIGEALTREKSCFSGNTRFYRSTDEFLQSFNSSEYGNEAILIKGARIFEFEKIAAILEQQVHQTVLEINLDAISSNLNEFRRHLNQGTQIMAMVKAFAYGAGPSEIASLMEFHRVNYLAVAYADEGVELRNAGVSVPIMVMNPDPGSAELLIRYKLEPEIFSFSSLERFADVADRHGETDYPVHIKIDTGMHRLGFLTGEIDRLITTILKKGCIRVKSVFSHLAASEDHTKDNFTHRQVELFIEASEKLSKALGYKFMRHILNSSGIFRFPQYQFEMVRPGIAIYGIGRYDGVILRMAGRFITRIAQIKKVPGGEPVGYGCADVSDHEREIAILSAGYADGFNRLLGNGAGTLFIRKKRVPVVGNVCMDMCMADVTGLGAEEGDEAEIFGENISIEEVAVKCQTIPYEILTSIPGRVKRIFFRE